MKAKPILLAILLLTFSKFNLVEAQTNPLTQEEIVTQINSILSEHPYKNEYHFVTQISFKKGKLLVETNYNDFGSKTTHYEFYPEDIGNVYYTKYFGTIYFICSGTNDCIKWWWQNDEKFNEKNPQYFSKVFIDFDPDSRVAKELKQLFELLLAQTKK